MAPPLFKRVRQVCTVVEDFEATVAHLVEDLGIGPFRWWHWRPPALLDTTFRGKPEAWTMKLAITWLGDLQYEVIQPVDGQTLYAEHLRDRGRGVQHLIMDTLPVSWEDASAALAAKGHPFAQTARVNPPLALGPMTLPALPAGMAKPLNLRFGYVDLHTHLGTDIELTRYPLGFSERFSLRSGKPEHCAPEGERNFESPLPGLAVRRVVKVGLVVPDIEVATAAWADLGGVDSWARADGCAAAAVGGVSIELARTGRNWIAFEAIDFTAAQERCAKAGYEVISKGPESVRYASRARIGTDIEILQARKA
jgi:hypothetical protein